MYCADMDKIFDSNSYGVIFETHDAGFEGETRIRSIKDGSISISVHSADCTDSDLLFNAETLYHEGQHALFYQALIEDGLEVNSTAAIQEAWAVYVSENFDIPYQDQHIAMVYIYMEKAAIFLRELNGNQLSVDHYMKYVYDGLKEFFDFPESDIIRWEQKYKELNGISPYTENRNVFSCN